MPISNPLMVLHLVITTRCSAGKGAVDESVIKDIYIYMFITYRQPFDDWMRCSKLNAVFGVTCLSMFYFNPCFSFTSVFICVSLHKTIVFLWAMALTEPQEIRPPNANQMSSTRTAQQIKKSI